MSFVANIEAFEVIKQDKLEGKSQASIISLVKHLPTFFNVVPIFTPANIRLS
jgi:hypothetical protein